MGREALPFAWLADEVEVHYTWSAGLYNFLPRFAETFFLTFPRIEWGK